MPAVQRHAARGHGPGVQCCRAPLRCASSRSTQFRPSVKRPCIVQKLRNAVTSRSPAAVFSPSQALSSTARMLSSSASMPLEPRALAWTLHLGFGLPRECQEVGRLANPRVRRFPAQLQPFRRIFADRLQHPNARRGLLALEPHQQALVQQRGQALPHPPRSGAAHTAPAAAEGAAAREHGQSAEQRPARPDRAGHSSRRWYRASSAGDRAGPRRLPPAGPAPRRRRCGIDQAIQHRLRRQQLTSAAASSIASGSPSSLSAESASDRRPSRRSAPAAAPPRAPARGRAPRPRARQWPRDRADPGAATAAAPTILLRARHRSGTRLVARIRSPGQASSSRCSSAPAPAALFHVVQHQQQCCAGQVGHQQLGQRLRPTLADLQPRGDRRLPPDPGRAPG